MLTRNKQKYICCWVLFTPFEAANIERIEQSVEELRKALENHKIYSVSILFQ